MASFDGCDIRRGMEVYDRSGAWIGTVLMVKGTDSVARAPRRITISPFSTSRFDGERTGPVSTQAIGNSGPAVQSRALGDLDSGPAAGHVERFLVGRWLGLADRRWYGVGAVVNLSLERIVVEG